MIHNLENKLRLLVCSWIFYPECEFLVPFWVASLPFGNTALVFLTSILDQHVWIYFVEKIGFAETMSIHKIHLHYSNCHLSYLQIYLYVQIAIIPVGNPGVVVVVVIYQQHQIPMTTCTLLLLLLHMEENETDPLSLENKTYDRRHLKVEAIEALFLQEIESSHFVVSEQESTILTDDGF